MRSNLGVTTDHYLYRLLANDCWHVSVYEIYKDMHACNCYSFKLLMFTVKSAIISKNHHKKYDIKYKFLKRYLVLIIDL